MPSINPYEQWPNEEPASTEATLSEAPTVYDIVSNSELRFFRRLERTVVLENVRERLHQLKPFINEHGGMAFFKTSTSKGDVSLLVTSDTDIAGEDTFAIFYNLVRAPDPGEPGFPNGRILEARNYFLPKSGRMLAYATEVAWRGEYDRKYQQTNQASVLLHQNNTVHIKSGLLADVNPPRPAGDLEGISVFSGCYYGILEALSHCNEVSHEEYTNRINVID